MRRGKQGAAGRRKRKASTGGKLLLAVVTFLNLALSLVLAIYRRREIICAVQQDASVQLLVQEKTTRTLEKAEQPASEKTA